jgi:hypothetical protein
VPKLARKVPDDPLSPPRKAAPETDPPKTAPEPKTSAPKTTAATRERRQKKDEYNAETIQAIRDAKAGKNLRRYKNTDDMFKDFGVK